MKQSSGNPLKVNRECLGVGMVAIQKLLISYFKKYVNAMELKLTWDVRITLYLLYYKRKKKGRRKKEKEKGKKETGEMLSLELELYPTFHENRSFKTDAFIKS